MKNILKLSIVVLLISCNALFAQDYTPRKPVKNVPRIVVSTFESKFPNADPVWFSQYQGRYNYQLVYDAKFIYDNRYSTAVFDNNANLIAFAVTIEASEVPRKAIDYMNKNYPYQPVSEAIKVSRGEGKSTIELGIYINNRFTIVVFDKDGNFIKTTLG